MADPDANREPEKKGPPTLPSNKNWFSKDGSFVNKLIFPAPEPSYTKNSFPGQLIWVPQIPVEQINDFGALREDQCIPCLLLRNYSPNSNHLMIYLHGNAADLGRCRSLCVAMMKLIGCHILAVEYPGYGIFPGWPNEDSVSLTVEQVYQWIVSPFGMSWPPSQIIIMGRSIGSGPAVHISQQFLKRNAPLPSQFNDEVPKQSSGLWNALSNMFDTANCVSDHTETDRTVSTQSISNDIQPAQQNNDPIYQEYPDPFLSMPNSRYMVENLLQKSNIDFNPNWSLQRLVREARANELIPPLEVCLRSNKNLKCALLVLYAPFESINHVVSSYAGEWARYLVSNRFRNIEKIQNVSCPLLIIHSEKDEIIPIEQGWNIYRRAQEHHVNVTFHRVHDLLHNETNVSRDIAKPIKQILRTAKGGYVAWDPPEYVFHAPIPLKQDNQMT